MAESCTVIVSSCDAYADLWAPCFRLYERHWTDRPFRAVLLTERLVPSLPGIDVFPVGGGLSWSACLQRALDTISTPQVLLTLEDFFLRARVDTPRLLCLLEAKKAERINMLRLIPRPGPSRRPGPGKEFGPIDADADYRVSAQAAFWTRTVLQSLLVAEESIWEFEIRGTERSRAYDNFAAVTRSAFPYRHHVVREGKWFPWAAREFQRQDIGVDLDARRTMSPAETSRWLLRKGFRSLRSRVPRSVRTAVNRLVVSRVRKLRQS